MQEEIKPQVTTPPKTTIFNMMSDNIDALATALAKAQGDIQAAAKGEINPHFGKSYADLADVWDACREPLSKNSLSIAQLVQPDATKAIIITMLMHSSGQWLRSVISLAPQRQDPQGFGAAITYARRFALSAMVGVAPDDDDDGESANGRKTKKERGEGTGDKKSEEEAKAKKHITEGQIKRLFAIMNAKGWTKEQMEEVAIAAFSLKESITELNMFQYDKLVGWIETMTYPQAVEKVTAWLAEKAKQK